MNDDPVRAFLDSEVNYVRTLSVICNGFLKPLRDRGLSKEDELLIFCNVETLRGINQLLLKEVLVPATMGIWHLLKPQDMPPVARVAEVYEKFAPFFKAYQQYCSNLPAARERLDALVNQPTALTAALSDAERHIGHPLRTLLFAPVQRICQYPLLLRELVQRAEPDEAVELLKRATHAVEEVVIAVNENAGDVDGMVKMAELAALLHAEHLVTPNRRLVATVECTVLQARGDSGGMQEGRLWLCNDMVLLGTVIAEAWSLTAFSPLHLASVHAVTEDGQGGHDDVDGGQGRRDGDAQLMELRVAGGRNTSQSGSGGLVDGHATAATARNQRTPAASHYFRVASSTVAQTLVSHTEATQRKHRRLFERQERASALRAAHDPALSVLRSLRAERRHGDRSLGASRSRRVESSARLSERRPLYDSRSSSSLTGSVPQDRISTETWQLLKGQMEAVSAFRSATARRPPPQLPPVGEVAEESLIPTPMPPAPPPLLCSRSSARSVGSTSSRRASHRSPGAAHVFDQVQGLGATLRRLATRGSTLEQAMRTLSQRDEPEPEHQPVEALVSPCSETSEF